MHEPASIVAARAVLKGQCPPPFCDAFIPRRPNEGITGRGKQFEPVWKPIETRAKIRQQEAWRRIFPEAETPRKSLNLSLACERGEVRTLLELFSDAIGDVLTFLRLIAEGEWEDNAVMGLPGMRSQSLHNRMVIALHDELTDLLREYDRLLALGVDTVLHPEVEKSALFRHVEHLEEMAGG